MKLREFIVPEAIVPNLTATDRDGAPVFLAKSTWELGYVAEKNPTVKLLKTREPHEVQA